VAASPALSQPVPTNSGSHCCDELHEHRTENREDFREAWQAINDLRWRMGLIFGGLALIAIEIPVVMAIFGHK